MEGQSLYQQGLLTEAIESLNATVKKSPRDVEARSFLAEMLCIQGNLERADRLLEALVIQEPSVAVGVSLQRQLIRAAIARKEFFTAGRVPCVLSEQAPHVEARMRASIALREGEASQADELLREAEEARPPLKGRMNSSEFADFRDLDDLLGDVVEVFTSTGKYYWIPLSGVQVMSPRVPERPIDVHWLPVEMTVKDGPEGVVYIPTTYFSTSDVESSLLLGRQTNWSESGPSSILGEGLRTFLVGEEDKTILELTDIEFAGQSE